MRGPDGQTEVIETTAEHPFYVSTPATQDQRPAPVGHEELNTHWVGAGHLQTGDKLRLADGRVGEVLNVTTLQKTQEMFNLSVQTAHTFYVGTQGWLVHNSTSDRFNPCNAGQLIEELIRNKVKFSFANLIGIVKSPSGKVIFLEKGNSRAGFEHILARHESDFAAKGIHKDDLANFLLETIERGEIIGTTSLSRPRPVFKGIYNGREVNVTITIGDNGFIVGANPI